MSDNVIILAVRVQDADAAIVGSIRLPCADCGRLVFCAPTSRPLLLAGATLLCLQCGAKRPVTDKRVFAAAPGWEKELAAFGIDSASIARIQMMLDRLNAGDGG